jgi:hypothetical protein
MLDLRILVIPVVRTNPCEVDSFNDAGQEARHD